jgi:hypothetical protein
MRLVKRRRGKTHLLSVVDFPDEGLPTRPMRGSRGIMGYVESVRQQEQMVAQVEYSGAQRDHPTLTLNFATIDKAGDD